MDGKIEFCRVRESGVSVYSCSPCAAEDLPDHLPGERSAISLGRRILNPVGELVKVGDMKPKFCARLQDLEYNW